MSDLAWVYVSYAVVTGVLGAYAAFVIRRGRRLARDVSEEHKYWT